jgi:hypothetical protein
MPGLDPVNPPLGSRGGTAGVVRIDDLSQRFAASVPRFGLDPIRPGPADAGPTAGSAPLDPGRAEVADFGRAGLPPPDLTRTNELLQQLLDEVRRGRPTTLPAGARSIRPER